jgi:hypothetical protein
MPEKRSCQASSLNLVPGCVKTVFCEKPNVLAYL